MIIGNPDNFHSTWYAPYRGVRNSGFFSSHRPSEIRKICNPSYTLPIEGFGNPDFFPINLERKSGFFWQVTLGNPGFSGNLLSEIRLFSDLKNYPSIGGVHILSGIAHCKVSNVVIRWYSDDIMLLCFHTNT